MDQNQPARTVEHIHASPICPHCFSQRIATLGYGRKIGGTVGTVAGAASGAAGAMGGAEIGVAVGMLAGPLGAVFGGIAGALLGGLAGGAVGGVAGAQLGIVFDENILDNYRCLVCKFTFSKHGDTRDRDRDCVTL